ncbi:hypothetical protein, partial [Winogradskyella sp.]|uniref:hypothetical protein n=1 Tax=Winogradskyella sp. TaxID=1883156 RepID=UPI0025EF78C7
MKKIYLLLIALIISIGFSNAQEADLKGIWEFTETYLYNGKTDSISTYITFKESGQIRASERDIGTWLINKSENTLTIDCFHFEGIDGENEIKTLDEKELKLKNSKDEINILKRISLPKGKELNNKFIGEWILEKVEKDGKTDFIGQLISFSSNGIFYWQEIMFGKWDYNKATKKICFDVREKEDELNGEHTIIEANETSLILGIEDSKLYFFKIDRKKIATANKKSGLIGEWEFEHTNPKSKLVLTFNEPDEFIIIKKQEGMESRMKGSWVFDRQEMSFNMIGLRGEDTFNGKNKIIEINEENLELENNGKIFIAHKKFENITTVESTNNLEHLSFTYEEFFSEDGNPKYENEKLPWLNWREMKKDILNINQLVYSYDFNDEDKEVFENEILTTNVIANIEDEGFTIEDVFKGYDNSGNPEQGPNTDNNHPLYPLNEYMFREAGNEQITTAAGTFDCTVIEVSNGYDMKKKLWMINDKIGVYAKIIDENTSEYSGYYHLYELQEIIY